MTKFTTVIYNPQKETPARNAGVYLGKRMVLLNKGVNELNEADLASIQELPQFGSLIENEILVISGNGDVLEPDSEVASIGSGSMYARSAALALKKHATNMSAEEMVRESLTIAADICIYTNHNLVIEKV